MKRRTSAMFQRCGVRRCSTSTLSVAMAIEGRSDRKLLSRICLGASGRKGSSGAAIAMLIMLPKFALVVIEMYLSVLANACRPSSTPWRSRSRSLRSSTTSALSRATSVAPSTEIPTSAACKAGASLMPSPRKPTAWPLRCRARTMRSFCCGSISANSVVRGARCHRASSRIAVISAPVSIRRTSRPTACARCCATCRLSPVMILTWMPNCLSCCSDCSTPALGGSVKCRKPSRHSPVSSPRS